MLEAPLTHYTFMVVNNTNQKIIINYNSIISEYEKSDTIQPHNIFEKEFGIHSCYKDYKDSLILKFFPKFLIQNQFQKRIIRDPLKSNNWEKIKYI